MADDGADIFGDVPSGTDSTGLFADDAPAAPDLPSAGLSTPRFQWSADGGECTALRWTSTPATTSVVRLSVTPHPPGGESWIGSVAVVTYGIDSGCEIDLGAGGVIREWDFYASSLAVAQAVVEDELRKFAVDLSTAVGICG